LSDDHDSQPGDDVLRAIYAARAVRDFADGLIAVLLPAYLLALGHGAFETGLVASVALFGSALVSLAIGLFGGGRLTRPLLLLASGLMALTGAAYAASEQLPVLLAVAFVGTINPSAGSVSVFAPLEHSIIASAAEPARRTHAFSIYSLIGALAAAAGALASGLPETLRPAGLSSLDALRLVFLLYGALGVAAGALYLGVPAGSAQTASATGGLGPSRRKVFALAGLFSIDSFAGGFAVQSLMALWLFERFGVSLAAAGLFFFWSGVLAAFSFPVATWLAKRIGLVNTMVFTHIPSSLCLILAAFAPRLEVALALLLVRAALSQMDVPARSSYVMAIVTPPERAAAASVTAVPRSLAAALSPMLAGALFAAGDYAAPLVLCGALKIAYDLALLWGFRHVRPPEEARG
jgi:MFS family permease